ncbi:GNAT family acetyltransferase [Fusobacterium necrophorum subsp. funduliforme]|uniref:GNAT family N-acetyltransferase n=1 Tax=Fusobacterium necrophorum TaxID=859 RepID=UPI0004324BB5|nr:GNAT family N-acetyltransferase [Fusobacterium necrophorum]AYV93073.1 GNAT family N-acetyltransferase [Fusobacterium necrophorum subsp. funduliforme]EYD70180.1 N-acetyltransferase GCN5 [Fusobacterium necrophorum subsp. funduliforme B35]KYM45444.1 GNAT family acetyltransferase [Fusobacterium necrophorum subsp. funduliforme]KYM60734.1 GNAT family acetyltransferase [Fusobacterium necrophorum subsp. funduliforme]KYM66275.1 GNAT family acetyltransferase [Fusobacterium necrophorum subsp. fundulif
MNLKRKKEIGDLQKKQIWDIYQSNSYYFQVTHHRKAKETDIEEDIQEVPGKVGNFQKYYELLYLSDVPIGILDYLENFPEEKTVYIGLYMIKADCHHQGLGRSIFLELEKDFQIKGFQKIRLAIIPENRISFYFWLHMGFTEKEEKIWKEKSGLQKKVIILEKSLKV